MNSIKLITLVLLVLVIGGCAKITPDSTVSSPTALLQEKLDTLIVPEDYQIEFYEESIWRDHTYISVNLTYQNGKLIVINGWSKASNAACTQFKDFLVGKEKCDCIINVENWMENELEITQKVVQCSEYAFPSGYATSDNFVGILSLLDTIKESSSNEIEETITLKENECFNYVGEEFKDTVCFKENRLLSYHRAWSWHGRSSDTTWYIHQPTTPIS